jgi:hypothetical protein
MNPAGADNGHLSDWNYDPIDIRVDPDVDIAVING